MAELFRISKMTAGDFQHSEQCKCKEKYLSKFSNVHKRKQTSLLAKVNSICFFLFPAAMLVRSGVFFLFFFLRQRERGERERERRGEGNKRPRDEM